MHIVNDASERANGTLIHSLRVNGVESFHDVGAVSCHLQLTSWNHFTRERLIYEPQIFSFLRRQLLIRCKSQGQFYENLALTSLGVSCNFLPTNFSTSSSIISRWTVSGYTAFDFWKFIIVLVISICRGYNFLRLLLYEQLDFNLLQRFWNFRTIVVTITDKIWKDVEIASYSTIFSQQSSAESVMKKISRCFYILWQFIAFS